MVDQLIDDPIVGGAVHLDDPEPGLRDGQRCDLPIAEMVPAAGTMLG
jgi:hypothetical protein